METREWKDLTVYENGKVTKGKKQVRPTGKGGIYYKEGSKKKFISLSRLVYEVFSGTEIGRDKIITHKDKNPLNCAYNNLCCMSLAEYRKKSGRPAAASKRFTKEEAEKIRNLYRRNKVKAGRTGNVTVRSLAATYKCSTGTIQKILNGSYFL